MRFYHNTFNNNNLSGFGNGNNDNYIDINSKPQNNKFSLDIYKLLYQIYLTLKIPVLLRR